MYSTLISTDALASQQDDSWVIVDCRYDLGDEAWGAAQYRDGHIPGAVYAGLKPDLAAPPSGTNGRHPLPCVEEIEAVFGRLGISAGAQVVAYDQDTGCSRAASGGCCGTWGTMPWRSSTAAGQDGFAKGDPRELERKRRPTAVFSGHRRKDLRLLVDQVAAALGDTSLLLVDARSPERFEGRSEPIDRTAGHIPGAVNHFHKLNVTDEGVMRSPEILREQFAATLGERSPAQVVMYCGSGVTACHNLLAMEYAGLSGGKVYPGSWSEWSADPARPVETGPARSSKSGGSSK
jgi:thiosulfate/3-mercaptopyruvate sulfurtransferase